MYHMCLEFVGPTGRICNSGYIHKSTKQQRTKQRRKIKFPHVFIELFFAQSIRYAQTYMWLRVCVNACAHTFCSSNSFIGILLCLWRKYALYAKLLANKQADAFAAMAYCYFQVDLYSSVHIDTYIFVQMSVSGIKSETCVLAISHFNGIPSREL